MQPQRRHMWRTAGAWGLALGVLGGLSACTPASPSPFFEVVHLHGSPYERGFQHGRRFASKIRSLYTRLLVSSLLPYLNRERADIASVMTEYQKPRYDEGRFSYEFLLDSGRELAKSIPEPYLEEMRGIADGAGLPYEDILLLNTFMDSLFNMRSITFFLRELQAPVLTRVEFLGAGEDGADNDTDGQTDEPGEGVLDPYEPSPWASMVEVPPTGGVRLWLRDQPPLTDPTKPGGLPAEGVDPASIRIQWDTRVLEAGVDEEVQTREVSGPGGAELEVTLVPRDGFAPGAVVSLIVQAGDRSWVTEPPPPHARFMRDERIVFTTRGDGRALHEVPNRGEPDGRTQPPSLAFAVRGAATPDGETRLAHHFAMLDSNTSHEHAVLFVHHPDEGEAFVVLGWAGGVWGFSGMNQSGLAYAVNLSDTLNNGMVGQVIAHLLDLGEARLVASGVPVGIVGRETLRRARDVEEAVGVIRDLPASFGWNFLLADARGGIRGVEVHSNILEEPNGGVFVLRPGDLDPWGRPWAGQGADDLRLASHAVLRTEDISLDFFGILQIRPQRYWTSFYHRSLRAFYRLGEEVSSAYGRLDASGIEAILRTPDLVDHRDSMNAVIFETGTRTLLVAAGQVPATDGPFVSFDLAELARVPPGAER